MDLKVLSLTVAGLALGVSAANAGEIDNASLAAPGVYYGTGNQNTGFTVDQSGSVEIGLEAIQRYIGPYTPTGSTYDVPTGATTVSGKSGSAWGFTFSVNLNADGNGTLNLSDITTQLSLTDVANGTTGSFDLLGIPDNTLYGSGGKCSPQSACGSLSSYYAFQNSETLSFASIAAALGDPAFNLNANDTYDFSLGVYDGNTQLASQAITVVAGKGATPVPEPVTISLFGAGLLGAVAARRRKRAIA